MDINLRISKVYFRANTRFPQTRFYFCLMILSEFNLKEILFLKKSCKSKLSGKSIDKYVKFAFAKHKQYGIPIEKINQNSVVKDLEKSITKTLEIMDSLITELQFEVIQRTATSLLNKIDKTYIYKDYLSFISGEGNRSKVAYRVNTKNSPLQKLHEVIEGCIVHDEKALYSSIQEEFFCQITALKEERSKPAQF